MPFIPKWGFACANYISTVSIGPKEAKIWNDLTSWGLPRFIPPVVWTQVPKGPEAVTWPATLTPSVPQRYTTIHTNMWHTCCWTNLNLHWSSASPHTALPAPQSGAASSQGGCVIDHLLFLHFKSCRVLIPGGFFFCNWPPSRARAPTGHMCCQLCIKTVKFGRERVLNLLHCKPTLIGGGGSFRQRLISPSEISFFCLPFREIFISKIGIIC